MQIDKEKDNRYDGWSNLCSQINNFNIYQFRQISIFAILLKMFL